jgi:hypothetical protein
MIELTLKDSLSHPRLRGKDLGVAMTKKPPAPPEDWFPNA